MEIALTLASDSFFRAGRVIFRFFRIRTSPVFGMGDVLRGPFVHQEVIVDVLEDLPLLEKTFSVW